MYPNEDELRAGRYSRFVQRICALLLTAGQGRTILTAHSTGRELWHAFSEFSDPK